MLRKTVGSDLRDRVSTEDEPPLTNDIPVNVVDVVVPQTDCIFVFNEEDGGDISLGDLVLNYIFSAERAHAISNGVMKYNLPCPCSYCTCRPHTKSSSFIPCTAST